jgi:hypothetical protein
LPRWSTAGEQLTNAPAPETAARKTNNRRIEMAWGANMGSRNRHSVETDQGHAHFFGKQV